MVANFLLSVAHIHCSDTEFMPQMRWQWNFIPLFNYLCRPFKRDTLPCHILSAEIPTAEPPLTDGRTDVRTSSIPLHLEPEQMGCTLRLSSRERVWFLGPTERRLPARARPPVAHLSDAAQQRPREKECDSSLHTTDFVCQWPFVR